MAPPPRLEFHQKPATILAIGQKSNSQRDLGAPLDPVARAAASLSGIFLLDRERNGLWSKLAAFEEGGRGSGKANDRGRA